ncbi:unnamed protein product [Bursaphelenchus xylophilus]|uniref:(pine wood nematode) hypothetical protein n=1 Tax=Bursaphelenchus xylophilus TaxID=6326 RepID=A0A7I8XBL3_BURXY|nr:unnamed protein product [Bursaphelenchus xylophilus]CAG9084273.1 unnamed protein product [Bursaphelenchus xylophilus]
MDRKGESEGREENRGKSQVWRYTVRRRPYLVRVYARSPGERKIEEEGATGCVSTIRGRCTMAAVTTSGGTKDKKNNRCGFVEKIFESPQTFTAGHFSRTTLHHKVKWGSEKTNLIEAVSTIMFEDIGSGVSLMAGETLSLTTTHPFYHDSNNGQNFTKTPGAWFFEVGPDYPCENSSSGSTNGELSPGLNDYNDEFTFNQMRASIKNVTETVEVPSSEHVAEIVGRQGCKIKALRAKTNTYIKTPVRGEEPVFVVTGREEDVIEAKREIECAAEHFTQIRASRRHSQGGSPAPGHVTAYVRVPLRVVGLVVGPKGATIKRIQQDTHTYIITPSREREPIFEVTGLPQNVDAARREIEQHIYQRTGNMPITNPNASIQSFDFQAAAAAACRSSTQIVPTNRPNYGALAAGTHEMRKALALEQLMIASKAAQESYASGDMHSLAEAKQSYSHAMKLLNQSLNAQAAAATQLGVAPPAPLQIPECPLTFSDRSNSPYEKSPQNILTSASEPAAFNSTSSAPNSTRGSSPAAPNTAGSQASLNNNSYNTWSCSEAGSFGYGFNTGTSDQSINALMHLFNNSCGLSSSSSGSRDEGIGDSPTSSLGILNGDPYHLMMSSIWSDLDPHQPPFNADVKVDSMASA